MAQKWEGRHDDMGGSKTRRRVTFGSRGQVAFAAPVSCEPAQSNGLPWTGPGVSNGSVV